MAFFGSVFGVQERGDDLECQLAADDPAADAQHVHVVVLYALARGISVVTDRRADAGDFVGRDADADTTAANQQPTIGFAAVDSLGDFDSEIGVVAGGFVIGSAVGQADDLRSKTLDNELFQSETGMVATNSQANGRDGIRILRHRTKYRRKNEPKRDAKKTPQDSRSASIRNRGLRSTWEVADGVIANCKMDIANWQLWIGENLAAW